MWLPVGKWSHWNDADADAGADCGGGRRPRWTQTMERTREELNGTGTGGSANWERTASW